MVYQGEPSKRVALVYLILALLGLFFIVCFIHGALHYVEYLIYYINCKDNNEGEYCATSVVKRPPNKFHIWPICMSQASGFFTNMGISVVLMLLLYLYIIYTMF